MNVKLFSITIGLSAFLLTSCSEGSTTTKAPPGINVQESSEESNPAKSSKPPVALPRFSMQDVNGNILNLQALRGKKLFVNLWASWCPPCRREMPSIEKLAQSVDTSKVAFVMLSLDDDFDKARAFMKKQKLHLPIYHPEENLPTLFNVQSIPTTFIFNETGKLVQRIDGGDNYNTEVYRTLLK